MNPFTSPIDLGESIYQEPELLNPVPDGSYNTNFGKVLISLGVITDYTCGR